MSVRTRRQNPPSPFCPDGSEWYACAGTVSFAGCCKSNACIQNQCPSEDLVAAIYAPIISTELADPQNANPSEDLVVDTFSPASSAGSVDFSAINLPKDIVTDTAEAIPHPPDEALNKPPSPSSPASSVGLAYSPIANSSTTDFTDTFPFPPEDTPNLPPPPLATPSIITTTTPSAISSLSSRMTTIGATVGGIGGLVILILLCVIFMLYRRQKTRKKPSPTHVHERQEMTRLEIDSPPYVSQLAGSPISELESPSNAIHELPLPGYHAFIPRRIPSTSKLDECYVRNTLTDSSLSQHVETPIDRSLKVYARGTGEDKERIS